MALKIEKLTEQDVIGTLDGAYSFELTANDEGVVARIKGRRHQLADRPLKGMSVARMRAYAYEALARFREAQKAEQRRAMKLALY